MGMSIDEAAYIIEHHKVNDINNAYDLGQAFTVAIDTMRKYQKLKNIICKWEDGLYDDEGVSHVEVLDMISNEVNGDGNDN